MRRKLRGGLVWLGSRRACTLLYPIAHSLSLTGPEPAARIRSRRHVAGGPIVASGAYWYWLGIEAAGDNNFYGLDGTLFGKGLPSLTSPYAHWVVSFQDTYNPTTLGCIIGHTGSAYTSYIGKHAMHVFEPALRVARSGMSAATVSCTLHSLELIWIHLYSNDVLKYQSTRARRRQHIPRCQERLQLRFQHQHCC